MNTQNNIANNKKDQIDDLIFDETLRQDGHDLYFVIDTYDIIEFFFPFQLAPDKNQQEYFSKYLAYQYLFYEYKFKPIVPDEYINELSSFRYHLKNQVIKGKNAFQDLKKFLNDPSTEFTENDTEFIKNNIGTVLALSMELLTPDLIDKFDELTKERLNILNIDIQDQEDRRVVSDIFKDISRSEKTKDIFYEYYDEVKYNLIEWDVNKRERHLDNALRDIIVIDRCLQINKQIIKRYDELNHKYFFLYLSSAPFKSTKLFNLPTIQEEQKQIGLHNYTYQGKSLNILRNAFQLFVQSSMDIDDKGGAKYLVLLKELSEANNWTGVIEKLEDDYEKGANKSLVDTLNRSIKLNDMISERVYKRARISKFFEYKERFEEALEAGPKSENLDKLKHLFENLSEDKFSAGANSVLSSLMSQTQYSSMFVKLFRILESYTVDDAQIITPEGKDLVRSNYQQFPLLLFYDNEQMINNQHYQQIIHSTADFLSNPNGDNKHKVPDFVKDITTLLQNLIEEGQRETPSTLLNIVLLYLNIIFPIVKDDEASNDDDIIQIDTEAYLIQRLKKLKMVTKYSRLKREVRNHRLEIDPISNDYLFEIDYLLVWLYRRQRDYELAINLCNENLAITSPELKLGIRVRFKHGKVLAELSKLYEDRLTEKDNTAMELRLKTAYQDVEEIIADYKRCNISNVLTDKTIIGLQNSACDVILKLYELTKKESYLARAQDLIEKIKLDFNQKLSKTKDSYLVKDFPALSDTISWFYVYKAQVTVDTKERMEFKKLARSYKENCEKLYTGTMYTYGQSLQRAINSI